MDTLQRLLDEVWMQTLLGSLSLALLAWLAAALGNWLLPRLTHVFSRRTMWRWDDAMVARGVFRQLARVLPMLVIRSGLVLVPGVPLWVETAVARITAALIVLFVALALSAAVAAVDDWHRSRPGGHERSIKGYVQLARIFVFLFAAIVILAALIDENAMTLLAGLGAVSAVLLLIFKDTILSVVASVQLASNDMLRVGDWIAMPEDNVDGDVLEVALHTVKVENWDKTVSTVPTWHLISKSFRNYRHMYATGRRIRRAIHIDATSVRHHSDEEIRHLRQFRLLDAYFKSKEDELEQWNHSLDEHGEPPINRRRLSNIGSFRAYMEALVKADPRVNTELFWAVRQLDPGPTGIPIQIYGYTVETGFVAHHHATDDIFDHLFAILPEFGLRMFQQPTGMDIHDGLARLTDPDARTAADQT